jgi:hypothetical protein
MVKCRMVLAPALVALGACATKPASDELLSGVVVATKFDTQVNFGSFDTFAVNPTVSVVRDVGDGGILPPVSTMGIVERITSNMSARGYQQVGVSERPNLGLQATVYLQINTATVGFTGFWWGAPGFASTPAFWGFPTAGYFEPWAYGTVAYRSGTLVIEMADLRDVGVPGTLDASVGPVPDAGDGGAATRLEIVWSAYAHGVTQELLASFGPQTDEAIDQAFIQSPYIQREGTAP